MATIFKVLEEANNFLLKEAETGKITDGNGGYKFVFYHVKIFDKQFGLCYNTNKFGGSYEST